MVSRIVEQKAPIKYLNYEHAALPSFTEQEWKVLSDFAEVLKPIAETVADLQSRRECMSAIIPNYLVSYIDFNLNLQLLTDVLKKSKKLTKLCKNIVERLDSYLKLWKGDRYVRFNKYKFFRNLLLSTALDARFKMDFFEDSDLKDEVREMLISEVKRLIEQEESPNDSERLEQTTESQPTTSTRLNLLAGLKTQISGSQPRESNNNIQRIESRTRAQIVSFRFVIFY